MEKIILDGRLDEPAWAEAKTYTGFKKMNCQGGTPVPEETYFKILPCEDRIYIGMMCKESNMEGMLANTSDGNFWETNTLEFFIAPSGNGFDYYQFCLGIYERRHSFYYSESGNIQPDPFAPEWNRAVYLGEDYWSAEIELPLTAFYMSSNDSWSDKWLFNVCRNRRVLGHGGETERYSWSQLISKFHEPDSFNMIEGFPMRPASDDLRITSAAVEITDKTETGYTGTMTIKSEHREEAEFVLIADGIEPVTVTMKADANELTVPCFFEELGRKNIMLCLKRVSDGKEFKRYYPVRTEYEPIKLKLTAPECKNNFYPGQDYSKVIGVVKSNLAVTLKLEGPGIETQTITPSADGSFVFDTAGFEYGDAFLTATAGDEVVKQKIRRLPATGNMMAWISGGNLVIDGKPLLRRNLYASYYHGGEALKERFLADDLAVTFQVGGQRCEMEPERIFRSKGFTDDIFSDKMPCDQLLRAIDEVIEANKGRDFVYYYLCDEPECRGVSPIYLKHLYEYIVEKDPYHVVLMASRNATEYMNCLDWVEAHPYICPAVRDGKRYYFRPIPTMGRYVDDMVKLGRTDKCIGFMPTCFAFKYADAFADYVTFDEMICHTWAGMLPGGKTLWPYAFHDLGDRGSLYEGTRYVFSSFAALEDMVLLAKRTDLLKTPTVHAVHYELGGKKMFVAANLISEPQDIVLEGIESTWHNFRHGSEITGNTFTLKPFEVLIGTSEVMDAGLPTYQETAALIDQQEYERTHGGSLLFERYQDIKITTMAPVIDYKLFDGIRDTYAWDCRTEREKFMELDLTVVKPNFNKVVISGHQIENMEIKVRNNGELSVPEITEVITEKYSTTFMLKDRICPDALRLEFHNNFIELYEIEVF